MKILVTTEPFNPWLFLHEHEQSLMQLYGKTGAIATFVGKTRDFNAGEQVSTLFLEHYPVMTEKCLQACVETAEQRWALADCLIVHRVGTLQPGETIILIAVWAMHRQAAFAGCQFLLEALKTKVPFWKRETLVGERQRWVEESSHPSS